MKSKKGNAMTIVIIAFVALLVLVAAGVILAALTGAGSGIIGDDDTCEYSYADRNVEYELVSANVHTGASVDPTFYVYTEEFYNSELVSDWNKGNLDVESGYAGTVTSSSGVATVDMHPGVYYVRGQLSGYYDDFLKITIPDCGDVPLSDYNSGGEESENVYWTDQETLSLSNQDLGTVTNGSTDVTYTKVYAITVDDDEGYNLRTIKLQEDATYSFATDTDGDNVYDEGINKIKVTIIGAGKTVVWTPFYVDGGINEFGSDDTAIKDLEMDVPEKETFTISMEVTADAQLDTTGDGDEKLGNGEDFIDSMILIDAKGTSATADWTA